MLKFYADKFVALNGFLCQVQLAYLSPSPIGGSGPAPSPLSNETLHGLLERINQAKEMAASIKLRGVVSVADRLIKEIGDPEDYKRHMVGNYADNIAHLLGEMSARLREELGDRVFLVLSSDGAEKYDSASTIFAGNEWDNFTEARYDLEEAVSCLALERSTAAVFHLMRAMETAVRIVGEKLGATVANEHGETLPWGILIANIKPKIEALPKGKTQDEWFKLHALLHSVNRAFRTKTAHPKSKYTLEEAKTAFNATKAFMQEMAERISEI